MDWNNLPWAAISAIIAVLIFIISQLKNKFENSRQLSYEVSINSQLVKKELLEKKIKYVYKGKELKNLSLVEIHFMNTGRKPITKSEFDTPIEILVGDESKIISHEINKRYPSNLPIELNEIDNKIVIEPLLLNSNNLFSVKILVTKIELVFPEVKCRIEGIDSIKPILKAKPKISLTALAFLIILADFAYIAYTGNWNNDGATLTKWTMIPILISFILVTIGTIKEQRNDNRYYRYKKYLSKSKP